MDEHPLRSPALRNARKRSLMITWLRTPPLTVIFDPGHKGVVMNESERDTFEKRLTLTGVSTMEPDFFTCTVGYENGRVSEEVVIPFAAIHTLINDTLSESHLWQQDYDLALARHRLKHNPMSRLLH